MIGLSFLLPVEAMIRKSLKPRVGNPTDSVTVLGGSDCITGTGRDHDIFNPRRHRSLLYRLTSNGRRAQTIHHVVGRGEGERLPHCAAPTRRR
jgi:hypothetical protein